MPSTKLRRTFDATLDSAFSTPPTISGKDLSQIKMAGL
jgi:hypothetical protein